MVRPGAERAHQTTSESSKEEQDQESKVARVTIPGYRYGSSELPRSPIGLAEFDLMKKTANFTDEDVRYLRLSYDILKNSVEEVLESWFEFMASQTHLIFYFSNRINGKPDEDYLCAVRNRFGQWVLDTARASYDEAWLDYQFEIGHRHHRGGKNTTDHAISAEIVHFRYIPPLIGPLLSMLKPYLERKGHPPEQVARMQEAWLKSMLLQVTLWTQPYVNESDF